MADDIERLEDFEREDTKKKLPLGWLILFFGLILWGMFYAASYTPQISGWTQEGQYHESLKQQ